ncbi:hypothetical protein ADUPG1_013123 [Aduncisulcus paluster]|uniref:Uncharacterized protein n=1 Tax=Aduncisulcus paluster TaxID=2918883 RepID=A0ABQ5K1U6_9EUKA|nr:hypothetical protein ADUPG1_013123 [Aduncisulcus paluster]
MNHPGAYMMPPGVSDPTANFVIGPNNTVSVPSGKTNYTCCEHFCGCCCCCPMELQHCCCSKPQNAGCCTHCCCVITKTIIWLILLVGILAGVLAIINFTVLCKVSPENDKYTSEIDPTEFLAFQKLLISNVHISSDCDNLDIEDCASHSALTPWYVFHSIQKTDIKQKSDACPANACDTWFEGVSGCVATDTDMCSSVYEDTYGDSDNKFFLLLKTIFSFDACFGASSINIFIPDTLLAPDYSIYVSPWGGDSHIEDVRLNFLRFGLDDLNSGACKVIDSTINILNMGLAGDMQVQNVQPYTTSGSTLTYSGTGNINIDLSANGLNNYETIAVSNTGAAKILLNADSYAGCRIVGSTSIANSSNIIGDGYIQCEDKTCCIGDNFSDCDGGPCLISGEGVGSATIEVLLP